ncbi:cytochrome b/b6 domain-containing protein [Rhodoferax sp.]|uniref:cytochrome b/b6 domain-containing protein n=1 Tax=Rhodoferax sp. TaxID=50421 RepID=UPI00275B549F|nr:cytochrome b/b6 domain-containing protein [Rhodoferax sp.]
MLTTVRVWDLPTRVAHWSLVVCVIGLVVTSQVGGAAMAWHFRFGYGVLSLLLFRVVWGMVGGHWSRFSAFLYSPSTMLRYLRGQREAAHSVGHSPLGAASVFAMLLLLSAQVATGLISDDEIDTSGPLTRWVSAALVSSATFYHRKVGKIVLILLILTHLGAIAYYHFKKHEKLVSAMIHGDKAVDQPTFCSRDDGRSRLGALAIFLVCAALVWLMLQLTATQP